MEYDGESKTRIFNDLLEYARRKNDPNTGTQITIDNFTKLYSLIYFDLRDYKDEASSDPKKLSFNYRLTQQAVANYTIFSIVLYEETVVIDKIGNELVIMSQ